ncbi:hypothetical protein V8F06_014196 [Rhypophila decipiens]
MHFNCLNPYHQDDHTSRSKELRIRSIPKFILAFEDYISTLRGATAFNQSLLEQCRSSICGALWGYGVPDISGIGVAVGYLLGTILGPFLSFLLLFTLSRLPTRSQLQSVLTAGLLAFFESAIYFALAIEIATIAILAPKDYESQVVAFGDDDARTCSLVSTICLLPLLYPVAVLSFLSSPADCVNSPANPIPNLSTTTPLSSEDGSRLTQITQRTSHRLTLFSLCTLLSLNPFLSQPFRTWAPTQVGTGNGPDGGTIVNDVEWNDLSTICFTGVKTLTNTEHVVLGIFHTIGSCVVFLFALGFLLPRGLSLLENVAVNPDGETTTAVVIIKKMIKLCNAAKTECRRSAVVRTLLLAIPVGLAAPLLWGFWRLRGLQAELARATGGRDEGDDWTFGQVVAITIFLPIGIEMVFAALLDRGQREVRPFH